MTDWQLACACVVSYAAFLRFDELVHIKAMDVKFQDDYMCIAIPKSKTDQLRKGDKVVVARAASKLCPVSILQNYMACAGILNEDPRFIFRPIVKSKHGEKLRVSGPSLTPDSVNVSRRSLSRWASRQNPMAYIA